MHAKRPTIVFAIHLAALALAACSKQEPPPEPIRPVKLAKVEARAQPITQTMLVVRDPQQTVVARLKDLQAQYAGSEIRIAACERAT